MSQNVTQEKFNLLEPLRKKLNTKYYVCNKSDIKTKTNISQNAATFLKIITIHILKGVIFYFIFVYKTPSSTKLIIQSTWSILYYTISKNDAHSQAGDETYLGFKHRCGWQQKYW